MAQIRVTTMLPAPPERVWADLSDLSRHVEWMSDATAIRFLTERRAGVGTTFDCDTKVGPIRMVDRIEITEWAPGKAMGVRHHGFVTGRGRFTLKRAVGGRTQFTWKERLALPHWLGGSVGALALKPVLTWVWRRNLRNLQARF